MNAIIIQAIKAKRTFTTWFIMAFPEPLNADTIAALATNHDISVKVLHSNDNEYMISL
jgi:hypothetical protein